MFYYTLGNLPPKDRSKLSSINVVSIVETPNLGKYGMDRILQRLVHDVKKLVK